MNFEVVLHSNTAHALFRDFLHQMAPFYQRKKKELITDNTEIS